MYCVDWLPACPQPQQGMRRCPPGGCLSSGGDHKGPLFPLLRRHEQNNNTISKGHLCNLFFQWLRVFLYLMQLCFLPFFWRWCLFISACLEIIYNVRPHNNAYLLRACDRVACKGCTGWGLHYSGGIKSINVSHMSSKMTAFILL